MQPRFTLESLKKEFCFKLEELFEQEFITTDLDKIGKNLKITEKNTVADDKEYIFTPYAKRVLKFSSAHVLEEFGLDKLLSIEEQEILKKFKVVISQVDVKEIELSFSALFALFSFALYPRCCSDESAVESLDGSQLLLALSDYCQGKDQSSTVRLVPPVLKDEHFFSLLDKLSQCSLNIELDALFTSKDKLTQTTLITAPFPLVFSQFSKKLKTAVSQYSADYQTAQRATWQQLAATPDSLAVIANECDIKLIDKLNIMLEELKFAGNMAVAQKGRLIFNFSPHAITNRFTYYLFAILRKSLLVNRAAELIINSKLTTEPSVLSLQQKGIKNVLLHYLANFCQETNRYKKESQDSPLLKEFAPYIFYPEMKNLIECLARQCTAKEEIPLFSVHASVDPDKEVRDRITLPDYPFTAREICSAQEVEILYMVFSLAQQRVTEIAAQRLQFKELQQKRAEYRKLPREELLQRYLKGIDGGEPGPVYVRKMLRNTNPLAEILQSCSYDSRDQRIYPASFIAEGTKCSTYPFQWENAAGVVLIPKFLCGFKGPARSDHLMGKSYPLAKMEVIGEILRDIGHKPYYTQEALYSKLQEMQAKMTFELLDIPCTEIINLFLANDACNIIKNKDEENTLDETEKERLTAAFAQFSSAHRALYYRDKKTKTIDLFYEKLKIKFKENLSAAQERQDLVKKSQKKMRERLTYKTKIITECLVTINYQKRIEEEGKDDASIIIEVLRESSGDIVAVFYKANVVETVMDALRIGSALKLIYDENDTKYQPLYVLLDESEKGMRNFSFHQEQELYDTLQAKNIDRAAFDQETQDILNQHEAIRRPLATAPGTAPATPAVLLAQKQAILLRNMFSDASIVVNGYRYASFYRLLVIATSYNNERIVEILKLKAFPPIKSILLDEIVAEIIKENCKKSSKIIAENISYKEYFNKVFTVLKQEFENTLNFSFILPHSTSLSSEEKIWQELEPIVKDYPVSLHLQLDKMLQDDAGECHDFIRRLNSSRININKIVIGEPDGIHVSKLDINEAASLLKSILSSLINTFVQPLTINIVDNLISDACVLWQKGVFNLTRTEALDTPVPVPLILYLERLNSSTRFFIEGFAKDVKGADKDNYSNIACLDLSAKFDFSNERSKQLNEWLDQLATCSVVVILKTEQTGCYEKFTQEQIDRLVQLIAQGNVILYHENPAATKAKITALEAKTTNKEEDKTWLDFMQKVQAHVKDKKPQPDEILALWNVLKEKTQAALTPMEADSPTLAPMDLQKKEKLPAKRKSLASSSGTSSPVLFAPGTSSSPPLKRVKVPTDAPRGPVI